MISSRISIPNTPRPMVHDRLAASSLQLLHGVVEEKVNKNSVNRSIGVLPQYLPANQFHAPDTTSYSSYQHRCKVLKRNNQPLSCISSRDPLPINRLSRMAVSSEGL